jgi:hypothetical protein
LRVHLLARIDDLAATLDERRDAQDRAVQAALQSAKEAVTKAETASEKRFDAVNEFRQTLADQASTLMPRVEAESRIAALAEKLEDSTSRNTDRIAALEGRGAGFNVAWGWAVGAAGVAIGIYLAVKP